MLANVKFYLASCHLSSFSISLQTITYYSFYSYFMEFNIYFHFCMCLKATATKRQFAPVTSSKIPEIS